MCRELRKQLEPLAMEGVIEFWADHAVEPGDPWRDEILAALHAAEVALFLISPEVWWSEFIRNVELRIACERASKGELVIIPVILRPCLWRVHSIDLPAANAGCAQMRTAGD